MALVDEKGNHLIIEAIDNAWTERLARTATVAVGGAAIIALYPMTTKEAKRAMVRGTMSKAIELGRLIRDGHLSVDEKAIQLARDYGGIELFSGKVADVERHSGDGFARGTLSCTGLGPYADSVLRVEFQNENLMALRDGSVVATVPDLICVMDRETLMPITTEALTYGHRVTVYAFPCDPVWRTSKGIKTVGPRYFGYQVDHTPLHRG
ncbi:MAG: DUF917 domain-containing protein [Sulfobacillus sp.]